MGARVQRLAVIVATASVALAACSGDEATPTTTTTTTTATALALKPPVIENDFTPIPCDEKTTTGRTGCALEQVASLDRQANEVIAEVFAHLDSDDAKRRFIRAEESWQAYRRDTCASRADTFEGGSEAEPERARCMAELSRRHVDDLRAYLSTR